MNTPSLKKVLVQIGIWFLVWVLMSFFISNAIDSPDRFLVQSILSLVGIIIVVSVNMYFCLPRFYFTRRVLLFIIVGLLLIFLTREFIFLDGSPWKYWMRPGNLGGRMPPNPPGERLGLVLKTMRYLNQVMPLIIAFLGNSLWVIAEDARAKEKQLMTIQKEKLESEIKFFRSQVNPHFLFNALNNIYSLSVLKSDKTPDSILSLSEMLRYMLYESDGEKVLLQKEIDYINNFVQLQLLKDSRGLNITLDTSNCDTSFKVAPLLFIPFIENAFKHSHIENLKEGFINIKLFTEAKTIKLQVVNSLPTKEFSKDKVGGIGLQNVKNRLELLYPNAHNLEIKQDDKRYCVNLSIEI